VGVQRPAVVRWERGERLPAPEQVQALSYALGAREEELVALTTGAFTGTPAAGPATWEEAAADLLARVDNVWSSRHRGLEELCLLTLQREAWGWAMREPAARPALARAYTAHAQYCWTQERWTEIGPLARRALAALPGPDPRSDTFLWAVMLSATAAAHGGHSLAPDRGIRQLESWVERSSSPMYAGWMLCDMARYAALAGQTETSLALAARGCRVGAREEPPLQLYYRRRDYGKLLLAAGRPGEALAVLPEPDPLKGHWPLPEIWLLWAEAHRRTGDHAAAEDALQQAAVLIEAHDRKRLRLRLAALSQQF
jgi:hypothetical protein